MACTSRPCTWRQGGKSVIAAPHKICDLELKKPTAMKPAPGKQLNTVQERLCTPHQTTKGMAFEKFLEELSEVSPRSVTLGERLPLRNPYYVELDINAKKSKDSSKLPKSISELAGEHQNVKDFFSSIPKYTDQDYKAIEKETRGQADNPVWLNQRDGRITASKFRDVYTRVESFKKNDNTDMDSIISRVLGYVKPLSNLPALKYGRRMESVAVEKFTEVLKENNHKTIEIIECGLFVDKNVPYLGASPDRLVKCCCGTRVLEVKCPLSCSHTKPSEETIDCLIKLNDRVELNKNHKYMDQIQGQMALTGCTKGYFFVFSRCGYLLREISFDEYRWNDMCLNFSLFSEKVLANELVNRTVKEKCAKECVRKLPTCDTSPVYSAGSTCTYTTKNTIRARKQTGKGEKGAKKIRPVYMCKICDKQILESDQMKTDEDQSIQ